MFLIGAIDVTLSEEETKELEAPYQPQAVIGLISERQEKHA